MDCPACHEPNVDGARFCVKCGALMPLPSTGAADVLVGQIVGGRYRITQVLGEGGMGRVYLAEQQMGTSVRKVAVKTLQSQYAKDPQLLARFHRECGTVSELEHPNTIQFFDFGQTPSGELYIAMEYVQGQSLSDALRQGPMAPGRVLRILAQVCGSLEEAHRRGIIHRDLKPDNVILSTRAGQTDFVKVLDFGIAKRSEAKDRAEEQKLTQQGTVLGTPPYMSPEQFTGRELDPRSDIYSLAVMAYEMLTGRLPFDAETPWQWATQHMTVPPRPFEESGGAGAIPAAMKQATLRALSKDRAERQGDVRQFYDELARGGAGLASVAPTAALPPSPEVGAPVATVQAPIVPPVELAAPPGVPDARRPGPGEAPSAHPQHSTPAGGQTFPTAPQPQAAPARAPRGSTALVGLAVAAGVLGLVGVGLVLRRGGSAPEAASPPVPAPVVVQPAVTPEKIQPPAPIEPVQPVRTSPATPSPKKPTPTPTASGGASTPPSGSAAPPPPPPLTADAACAEARRQAENGDAAAAARTFSGCSGAGAAGAKAAIARAAPDAVRRRIFNGDCAGARSVVTALSGIGAGASAQAVLDSAPQCKH